MLATFVRVPDNAGAGIAEDWAAHGGQPADLHARQEPDRPAQAHAHDGPDHGQPRHRHVGVVVVGVLVLQSFHSFVEYMCNVE